MKHGYLWGIASIHYTTTACQAQRQIVCVFLQSSLYRWMKGGLLDLLHFSNTTYQIMTYQIVADQLVLHMLALVCFIVYTDISHTQLVPGYCIPDIMLGIQAIKFCYSYSFPVVPTALNSVNSIFLNTVKKAQLLLHHKILNWVQNMTSIEVTRSGQY